MNHIYIYVTDNSYRLPACPPLLRYVKKKKDLNVMTLGTMTPAPADV